MNFSAGGLARIASGQHRDEIVLLVALLEQRRKRRFELGELRLLGGDVGAADVAFRLLVLEKAEDLAVDADQLVGRLDLVFERGFLDRGLGDIRAERDVDRDHLVAGRLLLRRGGFDGPLVEPEHVGHVGHAELGRDQRVEKGVVAGTGASAAEGSFWRVIANPALTCGSAAPCCARVFSCATSKRRLRSLEVGIVGERLLRSAR